MRSIRALLLTAVAVLLGEASLTLAQDAAPGAPGLLPTPVPGEEGDSDLPPFDDDEDVAPPAAPQPVPQPGRVSQPRPPRPRRINPPGAATAPGVPAPPSQPGSAIAPPAGIPGVLGAPPGMPGLQGRRVPGIGYPVFGEFGAPSDPEMAKLQEAERNLEVQTQELVERFHRAQSQQNEGEKEAIKKDLLVVVAKHFAVRQQRRGLEIKRLEAQLERLRESVKKREESREAIVASRVSQLVGDDDLGF